MTASKNPPNAPKRWIETESGSTPLERALLRPALDVDIPPGAEQAVWMSVALLVPLSATTTATASATAGAAGATPTIGVAKLGVAAVVKAFAIGAASGSLIVGGYTALDPHGQSSPDEATTAAARIAEAPPKRPASARSPRAPSQNLPDEPGDRASPAMVAAPSAPHPGAASSVPDAVLRENPTAEPSSVTSFPPLPSASSAAGDASSRLRQEALVLRRAREALRRGDLTAAFANLERARTEFPRGALGEEREALTIQVLARSGQTAAARARAAAFVRAHPNSAYLAAVRDFVD